MVLQKIVSKSIFSFWLNRDPTSRMAGEILFGGMDWTHFRGLHTYVPVSKNGYWEVINLSSVITVHVLQNFICIVISSTLYLNKLTFSERSRLR